MRCAPRGLLGGPAVGGAGPGQRSCLPSALNVYIKLGGLCPWTADPLATTERQARLENMKSLIALLLAALALTARAQIPSLGFCPEYLPMTGFDMERVSTQLLSSADAGAGASRAQGSFVD